MKTNDFLTPTTQSALRCATQHGSKVLPNPLKEECNEESSWYLSGHSLDRGNGGNGARPATDGISIVGSSTVYPFATVVAEKFGKAGSFKSPKIESTGTGGGFKLFCGGSESSTPICRTPRAPSRPPSSRPASKTASRTSSRSRSATTASWSPTLRKASR